MRYLQRKVIQDLKKKEDISGFDHDFKANLSSYMDFEKKTFWRKACGRPCEKDCRRYYFLEDNLWGDDSK